jgi:pre-mRNA-processing factor 6
LYPIVPRFSSWLASASGFTTRSDIGPACEGPSAEAVAEAQARRGEEPEIDPEQFQDPDNEYGDQDDGADEMSDTHKIGDDVDDHINE